MAIERSTGISFRPDQHEAIRSTIARLMTRLGMVQAPEFLSALANDSHVFEQLVGEITVGETYFFREPKQFEFVERILVPEFRASQGSRSTLRAWSAGCATGEEAYSLAILCQNLSQPVDILATDLSLCALEKARKAEYRDWSFRGGAQDRVKDFITQVDQKICLKKSVRQRVLFRTLNLAQPIYPDAKIGIANFDLIFCRNVLIYFASDTIEEIASRLYQCLSPGGWLVTASGDPSVLHGTKFEPISTPYGMFYRKPNVVDASIAVDKAATAELPKLEFAERPDVQPTSKLDSRQSPSEDSQSTKDPASKNSIRSVAAALLESRKAFESGDYRRAIRLAEPIAGELEARLILIRALAHIDREAAILACEESLDGHSLSDDLHFLHARFLMDSGRLDEALKAIKKSLFLDRSNAIVHFLFGTIQYQRGQWDSAYRHFNNSLKLCQAIPSHHPICPFGDETAGEVAAAASMHMNKIRPGSA
jgi:chemotaxis protein methyltransferase CheR